MSRVSAPRVNHAASSCEIGRGKVSVSDLVSELDDRRGPQPAVEVIVEQHLRRRPHRFERQGRRHPDSLLTRMRSDVLE